MDTPPTPHPAALLDLPLAETLERLHACTPEELRALIGRLGDLDTLARTIMRDKQRRLRRLAQQAMTAESVG